LRKQAAAGLISLRGLLKLGEPAEREIENGFVVVTQVGQNRPASSSNGYFIPREIVVKLMAIRLRHIQIFRATQYSATGAVILILIRTE
jgi:two-component system chemotaxis sensor kinase CheA